MQRIGVAIGKVSGGMFWEALETLLEDEPDIDICRFSSSQELEGSLPDRVLHALILEKPHRWKFQPDYQRYFSLNPGLAIIVLDATGTESIVRFGALGCDLLMRLLRTLATDSDAQRQREESPIRSISAPHVKRLAIKQLPPETTPSLPYASTREHLDDVRVWLNLCLHQSLIHEAATDENVSTPGWAMSAKRARSLLNDGFTSADVEMLRQAREDLEEKIAARETATRREGIGSKLITLSDAFDISELEWQIIAFTLAPELDDSYARVFGYLNDDLNRRRPTASILRKLILSDDRLAWDIRQLLTGDGSLAAYQLLTADPNDALPASESGLRLAPEIVAYLLAEHARSSTYGTHLEIFEPRGSQKTNNEPEAAAFREKLELWQEAVNTRDSAPIIQLVGGDATLRWFERMAINAGQAIVVLDARHLAEQGLENLLGHAVGAARVTILHQAILLITGLAHLQRAERARLETALIARVCPLVHFLAVHGEAPWVVPGESEVWQFDHVFPDVSVRARLWREGALASGHELSESDARALAAIVRFDEPDIDATLRLHQGALSETNGFETLLAAARQVARTMVPSLVRRLETVFDWEDIVLPRLTLALLQQIPGHVRHAGEVFEEWGYRSRFPFGSGVAALFSGPSGTGKTMAAQIIASELGVELFQIDLANTVSKYIGETEKNLDIIFNAAERASAVLLFDEADALFGKRTEAKDAHDRYANIEVAYLLQRMEAYPGLAILTTNFKQNLDSAFLRRLRFVIDFPAPSAAHREAIWRCVFPPEVPFAEDVDTTFLARRLELTGGHIQQIAVRAAFAAVADGGRVAMKHIVQATREELIKLGMLSAERTLADLVPMPVGGERS